MSDAELEVELLEAFKVFDSKGSLCLGYSNILYNLLGVSLFFYLKVQIKS